MARHFESVLEKIIQEIYKVKTLDEGKILMIKFVEETKIKQADKTKMIYEVNNNIKTLTKLQFYATNCMFKFEGLGINYSGSI